MFPRLRQRLGSTVLDRIDVLVELSTLGEYGLAEDGLPIAIGAGEGPPGGSPAVSRPPYPPPRPRDRCALGPVSSACGARPTRP